MFGVLPFERSIGVELLWEMHRVAELAAGRAAKLLDGSVLPTAVLSACATRSFLTEMNMRSFHREFGSEAVALLAPVKVHTCGSAANRLFSNSAAHGNRLGRHGRRLAGGRHSRRPNPGILVR